MQKRCEENGEIAFYVRIDDPQQENLANDALQKDLKMLKGWHMSVGSALQPALADFRSTIDITVNKAYEPIAAKNDIETKGILSGMWQWFTTANQISFPYLEKGELVKQALENSANELKNHYQSWCRLLNTAMKNEKREDYCMASGS
ncbi:unnamed protein product [Aphanomyces euteiches]